MLGKYDKLKELLDKALTVPGFDKSNVFNEYGTMYEQMGEYDKAMDSYRECARKTLNKDTLQRAKDSIQRCQEKKSL